MEMASVQEIDTSGNTGSHWQQHGYKQIS